MAISRSRKRDDNDSVAVAKPRSDAYTGLLAISLVAMIAGCVLLYMDMDQYGQKKPDLPPAAPQGKAVPGAQK